jgi:hypothetical protein
MIDFLIGKSSLEAFNPRASERAGANQGFVRLRVEHVVICGIEIEVQNDGALLNGQRAAAPNAPATCPPSSSNGTA